MPSSVGTGIENRLRKAWADGPGRTLRLLAAAYGSIAGARNLMYDSGILASRRSPIPVVSVGGLTVGGSGKTPIAADLAARLCAAGVRTAILTHGFRDEMDVHATLVPDALVYGGRDRVRLAHRAAGDGARIAVLDSGFQHRRLHRDLDIVCLDEKSIGGSLAPLPAGPFREGLTALARADLVIVVRREAAGEDGPRGGEPDSVGEVRDRVSAALEARATPPVVSVRIRPGPLVEANEPARTSDPPRPVLAVAGIMWPEEFFAEVRRRVPTVCETVSLGDHARITRALADRLRDLSGNSGLVCTLKDSLKLVRALGDASPIWYLSEEVTWERSGPGPVAVRAALDLLDPSTREPREGTGHELA